MQRTMDNEPEHATLGQIGDRRDVPRFLHATEPKEKRDRRGFPTYSVERSQFWSRSPLTRENSLSLSVTIT